MVFKVTEEYLRALCVDMAHIHLPEPIQTEIRYAAQNKI